MRARPDAGERLAGRYLLQERVGSGGMGIVWRAHDEKLDRTVAVKCARLEDESAVRRLRSEARNAARLHHPHIVSVFDRVDEGDDCWLVMEYVPARSLARIVADEGTLEPERAAAIGWQVADALAAAHAAGVVHGDVTPENILVTEEGLAKLTDFGISRALWSDATHSGSDVVPGKPRYIAPEVARGIPASRESDGFSLGATLYAAVEGRSPYGEAATPMAYIGRAVEGHIEAPSRASALTEPLTALLREDPGHRPTAVETRDLLERVAPPSRDILRKRDDAMRQRSPRSLAVRTAVRRPRRRTAVVAGAALAVAAALVAAALLYPPWGGGPGPSGTGGAARTEPDGAGGVLGAPRTADPCGLLDAASLHSFGSTELVTDYGDFDRCDVLVQAKGDSSADIAVTFLGTAPQTGSEVATRRVGGVTVASEPLDDDECDRTLELVDGGWAQIMARRTGSSAPSLCALADTATGYALKVLARGPVPRRPSPPDRGSLAQVDACGLLDATAVGRLPGMATARPRAGFGDWGCGWSSDTNDTDIDLMFDRSDPLDSTDGHRVDLGGRPAFVTRDFEDDDTCTVRIVNREYTDITGEATEELVELTVSDAEPAAKRCATAEGLGAVVAAGLPARGGQ